MSIGLVLQDIADMIRTLGVAAFPAMLPIRAVCCSCTPTSHTAGQADVVEAKFQVQGSAENPYASVITLTRPCVIT